MPLKRPTLKKRQPDAAAASPSQSSYAPPPLPRASGSGISTRELQAALGGAYSAPSQASSGAGITTQALGAALTGGGAVSPSNGSVPSSRHTSYATLLNDITSIPAKAGTRTGPRTTSYRIPLHRSSQQNVYDTVN